jgi:type II secretory pathway component GspD/PulD (secretin)
VKRKARALTILVVTLAFLLGGPRASAANVDLDKRISLNLEDADLRMVFELYKEILGVEADIDPVIDKKISITFDDITVRTSLNAICESAKCRWELVEGDPGVLRVDHDDQAAEQGITERSREESQVEVFATHAPDEADHSLESPVSLELTDADATVVLEVAAKIIGARLLMDKTLEGSTITINASGVPLSTILDTMCADLGCAWNLTDGDPPTLGVHYPRRNEGT